jgi:hypothetical protein
MGCAQVTAGQRIAGKRYILLTEVQPAFFLEPHLELLIEAVRDLCLDTLEMRGFGAVRVADIAVDRTHLAALAEEKKRVCATLS